MHSNKVLGDMSFNGSCSHGALRQISLNGGRLHKSSKTRASDGESHTEELQRFRQNLLRSCSQWPLGFDVAASPFPLLVPESLLDHLEKLGNVLCCAITNIVERWWTDSSANFPGRMPIPPHQEAVLRWIEKEGKELVPSYATRKGAWRPDFLLNAPDYDVSDISYPLKKPQICEINARFSFNGFLCSTFAQEAYEEKEFETLGLKSPIEPFKVFAAFKDMLDLSKPIHLLKVTEAGLDIHLFASYIQKRCGLKVRFIKPENLRLVHTTNSKSGPTLCCTLKPLEETSGTEEEINVWGLVSPTGEPLEQIHQVALELHQWEMQDLGDSMLKALAPLCFNDLRTIYLVHDKRMLGIVLQELEALVNKYGVLTQDEADMLRDGIVPTILPASHELESLIQRARHGSEEKDDYLLKPVGSGKGKGIIFGTDVTTDEWIESLLQLSKQRAVGQIYVVQPVVKQPRFDVVILNESGRSDVQYNHIVGTSMMLNGKNLGIACWRTSSEKICAVSNGGTWMCTLVQDSSPTPTLALTTSDVPRLTVSDLDDSKDTSKISTINAALQKHGILIISPSFPDPDSTFLLNLVQSLQLHHSHGATLTHSAARGWLWDVKPTPKNLSEQHQARSETMEDFPWHTDCSYALDPPKFFGLHILQADRCGGGTLSVLQLGKVLRTLSKKTVEILHAKEFRIQVPPEFMDGTEFVVGSVLTPTAGGEVDELLEPRCRYRADIIHPLTERAEKALQEFNGVLAQASNGESSMSLDLTPEMIPNGSIVLIDNGRWLHARNEVKDIERHLRRIRWDPREF